jgi:hypothetical protein
MKNKVIEWGTPLYLQCFRLGRQHVAWKDIYCECEALGWSLNIGHYKSYIDGCKSANVTYDNLDDVLANLTDKKSILDLNVKDLPMNVYEQTENRFFPCNDSNKPIVKWGKECFSLPVVRACKFTKYIGENLKHTNTVILDIDGDHDKENINWNVINYFNNYKKKTQYAQSRDTSYHLVFRTDRLIPTYHLPFLDILGNANNQARYYKDKVVYGTKLIEFTQEIVDDIKEYVRLVERKDN